MNGMVEMFRDAAERHGRDRFSCSVAAWRFFKDLAVTYGWQPRGTTYSLLDSNIDPPARHNYEAGDSRDRKYVEADDAIAWANALEAAKSSAHSAAMIDAAAGDAPLRSWLEEFVAYAYGGAFAFAISPAPASSPSN